MKYAYTTTSTDAEDMVKIFRTKGYQSYAIACFGQFEVRYWKL